MSSVEDRVHAAMSAAADLAAWEIRTAPPLRLPAEPEAGPRRVRPPRRWPRWWPPLAAAAAVIAVAATLVAVKSMQNPSSVSGNGTASAPVTIPRYTGGTKGVPRYYVALKRFDVKSGQYGIVEGDSLTGTTLATFAPPAGTTFQSVSAAADNRTFVIVAVTSSTGSFSLGFGHATLTGSWYELRLAPGRNSPYPAFQTFPRPPRSHGTGRK